MKATLLRLLQRVLVLGTFLLGLSLSAEWFAEEAPCVPVSPDADVCLVERTSELAEAPP